MVNYIGMDAHSATCTFVNLDREGKLLDKARVKTSEKNLLAFIERQEGVKKLVFEETNLSKWLHVILKDHVDELVVCNPTYIGNCPGAKGDEKDAWNLADELRCNHLVPVFHEESELMDLRVLISGYSDLIHDIIKAKNRYKSLFRSQGLPTTGSKFYFNRDLIKGLSNRIDQMVANGLFDQIEINTGIKERYFKKFRVNMRKQKTLKILTSIPGFSDVRSHIVAALVCSPGRFKNKHNFWSYCGLVKYEQVSDDRLYGKKKVYGRSELKAVFDGAALTVIRGNSSLRRYYDQLRSKGYPDRQARKMVARRIASICLAVLKKEVKYNDKYEEDQNRGIIAKSLKRSR